MPSQIVNARIDSQLKNDVDHILANIGLSSAEAIRLLFTQIRNTRSIPFPLIAPEEPSDILKQAIARSDDFVAGKTKGFKKCSSVNEAMTALLEDDE